MSASDSANKLFEELFRRHPLLEACRTQISAAYEALDRAFANGNKLLVCGNGGSAADADHIVGELMKRFRISRPLPDERRSRLAAADPSIGPRLAEGLNQAFPALSLVGHGALASAMSNDVDPLLVFAQQVQGLGQKGDVLLAISTSGNSENVLAAAITARVAGLATIGLTGAGGGRLAPLCDVAVRAPATETSEVQELHLPVYHALCAMVEAHRFGNLQGT